MFSVSHIGLLSTVHNLEIGVWLCVSFNHHILNYPLSSFTIQEYCLQIIDMVWDACWDTITLIIYGSDHFLNIILVKKLMCQINGAQEEFPFWLMKNGDRAGHWV